MKPGLPLLERFFSYVEKDGPVPPHCPDLGPCWLWTGATNQDGYGVFRVARSLVRAHRLAWRLAHGRSAPSDRKVLHHCDNPPCVRPSHLWVGSQQDNLRDASAKGRTRNQHTKEAA